MEPSLQNARLLVSGFPPNCPCSSREFYARPSSLGELRCRFRQAEQMKGSRRTMTSNATSRSESEISIG
ncbi:hypothetical protein MLD38_014421 [Melastoma candidum]|uniref:Uncharacterized protein n=1 Tax=Melastoma candidum TaxID=119954 RepID=A0ACB9RD92_9MYRT|nr:hypothetical protein MLD38_014421 [Melastoma candidum]